jgi:glycosyltransferase involved in cell wall biosynthesis
MRIGVISLGRRGAGGLIGLQLAVNLQKHAHVFCVVSEFAENLEQWRASGVDLSVTLTYQNFRQALVSWINLPSLYRLARMIRQQQPDVLLFPIFHTWTPFLQLFLKKIPSVIIVHDPQPHPGDLDWIFENQTIRRAARCILLSKELKQTLVQRGVSEEQIDVIPLGPLAYEAVHADSSDLPSVILFFGRITPYKGLDILLEAYRELRKTHPIHLLIAGEGDLTPYRHLLQDLEGVQLENRWIPDNEVGAFLNRAAMVVLPYTSATQSGVLAAAAASGLPVIATRTGGIPEQIQDGLSGLLVEPGSSQALHAAMVRLLDDPSFALQLGQKLRHEYQTRYGWVQAAEQVFLSCQRAGEMMHRG